MYSVFCLDLKLPLLHIFSHLVSYICFFFVNKHSFQNCCFPLFILDNLCLAYVVSRAAPAQCPHGNHRVIKVSSDLMRVWCAAGWFSSPKARLCSCDVTNKEVGWGRIWCPGSIFPDPRLCAVRGIMIKQTYYHLTLNSFNFKGGEVNLFFFFFFFKPQKRNPSYDHRPNEMWQNFKSSQCISIIEDCYWFLCSLRLGFQCGAIKQTLKPTSVLACVPICVPLRDKENPNLWQSERGMLGHSSARLPFKWNGLRRCPRRGTVVSLCIPLCLATDQLHFARAAQSTHPDISCRSH